tara:strand:+ start:13168 stop:13422 length:255 start_codon:yes stop_codon:yes gene_type:complete
VNGRKSKLCRRLGKEMALEWLKTLVSKEEAEQINSNNFISLMPKQTHIMNEGQMRLMPNSIKWFYKRVKEYGVNEIENRKSRIT